jgi:hypothetical protein
MSGTEHLWRHPVSTCSADIAYLHRHFWHHRCPTVVDGASVGFVFGIATGIRQDIGRRFDFE